MKSKKTMLATIEPGWDPENLRYTVPRDSGVWMVPGRFRPEEEGRIKTWPVGGVQIDKNSGSPHFLSHATPAVPWHRTNIYLLRRR